MCTSEDGLPAHTAGLLAASMDCLGHRQEILCMSLSRHRSSSASSTRSMHLRQFQEPRKILTHHAIQTEFLQLLGVDKASCLQILCTECVALRPLASGSPQPKWPRPTSSKSPSLIKTALSFSSAWLRAALCTFGGSLMMGILYRPSPLETAPAAAKVDERDESHVWQPIDVSRRV